ncbi:hypothetical protein AGMMS49944_19910 [Spirochaetia bacterium]|nr:hypothetical protein AGMMS49944_19910 [Spirochaetia bacterium]
MKPGALLVVPTVKKSHGGGHLARGSAMVRSLRAAGREAFLFLPEMLDPRKLLDIAGLQGESWILQGKTQDPRYNPQSSTQWDFIILDKFRTDLWEAASWAALAPLIGIDEGGAHRDKFDFLIDLLPPLPKRGFNPPNITAPSLIPLPHNRRPSFHNEDGILKVLVSFGAEDAEGLTFQAAMALGKQAHPHELAITVIAPGLPEDKARTLKAFSKGTPGITVLKGMPDLREHLAEYDILITHFGLTAFEALHARLPVCLLSPTPYHEKLARNAGFFSAGEGPAAAGNIGRFFFSNKKGQHLNTKFLNTLAVGSEKIAARYGLDMVPDRDLGEFLARFNPLPVRPCPACGAPFFVRDKSRGIPTRFSDRTYRRCTHCGMIYMHCMSPPGIEYETDYFFDSYKSQYGKTYLEDFPNLVDAGKKRLAVIKRFLNDESGRRLLDIGCAYGPFLSAASAGGFSVQGIDPSSEAVRFVRENLGISANESFFPDPSLEHPENAGSFAVITLWYVLEHFEDLRWVLVEINRLLAMRGVLAFSTPTSGGISGKKSLQAFLEKSPPDHRTIWSPKLCRRILARYGFRLKKIRITGHHPERFPLGNHFKQGGILRYLLLLISRIFRLGDTFECYAIKVKSLW